MNIMLFFVNTSHLIQKSSRSRDQNISLDAILTCPQIDHEIENAHAVYMKKVLSVNQSIKYTPNFCTTYFAPTYDSISQI